MAFRPRSYLKINEVPQSVVNQIKTSLPNLQDLDLRGNALTSLPEQFGELSSLQTIRLSFNKLNDIPMVLSEFPDLQRLEFSGNMLTQIPDHLSQCTSLKHLDISGNSMTALDENIAAVTTLQTLNAENNSIESISPSLCEMLQDLQRLSVATNRTNFWPSGPARPNALSPLIVVKSGHGGPAPTKMTVSGGRFLVARILRIGPTITVVPKTC